MGLKGHCMCGQSTWEAKADKPEVAAQDHCDTCMRQTGSAFSWVGVFKKDQVTISGPTKTWSEPADSGKHVIRTFCSNCGSPLAHAPDADQSIIAMKLGTLDKESRKNPALKPAADVYGKDILSWVEKTGHFNERMP